MTNGYPLHWPQFFTATNLDWLPVLRDDRYKLIVIDALRFAVEKKRVSLTAFVIMSTHFHVVWQMLHPFTREFVQQGLMKYTAQKIKYDLQLSNPLKLVKHKVDKCDREYQIWKRRPLSIELYSPKVFQQKVDYIHNNPVKAGICKFPEEYKFSSAAFYHDGTDHFGLFNSINTPT